MNMHAHSTSLILLCGLSLLITMYERWIYLLCIEFMWCIACMYLYIYVEMATGACIYRLSGDKAFISFNIAIINFSCNLHTIYVSWLFSTDEVDFLYASHRISKRYFWEVCGTELSILPGTVCFPHIWYKISVHNPINLQCLTYKLVLLMKVQSDRCAALIHFGKLRLGCSYCTMHSSQCELVYEPLWLCLQIYTDLYRQTTPTINDWFW